MASDLLHIKDGYFFEFPTMLVRSHIKEPGGFPAWYIRNDADYQSYEADQLIASLTGMGVDAGALAGVKARWEAWKSSSDANFGWPLDGYLEQQLVKAHADAAEWAAANDIRAKEPLKAYLAEVGNLEVDWYYDLQQAPEKLQAWTAAKAKVDSQEFLNQYLAERGATWSQEKIESYNRDLDGKIMIPQPFATLRNAYEVDSGFGISRYMVIEVIVAILLFVIFGWLARRVRTGDAPKGKRWNMLEALTQGVRNQIVVPAMGEHDADRFMPYFYSLFFFILGCNLMGMIPSVGSPTAAFGTTLALAGLTFLVGIAFGVKKFGVAGYLKNIVPDLGLPWYLAIGIVPMLWVIEALSLVIKHVVLAVRLLLNMSAGHLVMLGILGIGISVEAAQLPTWGWGIVAGVSVLGTTLLSFLELFVAFLQAFVFTFLAAMLIGSQIHHH